jgi:hypothetical protein
LRNPPPSRGLTRVSFQQESIRKPSIDIGKQKNYPCQGGERGGEDIFRVNWDIVLGKQQMAWENVDFRVNDIHYACFT